MPLSIIWPIVNSENASPAAAGDSTAAGEGLLKSSGVASSMTMISRVLGLARDIVIARLFGVGEGVDAFFLANKIPNFMRRLFAEGAFNQAFVPVLSEYRSQRSHAEVRELVNAVAAALGGLLTIVTVLVVAAAPLLATGLAYGFLGEPEKFAIFVDMFRITFPYLLLISMTAMCGAVLNSYGYFAGPAITPAMLNLSLIGCSFLLAPWLDEPALALAWGVLIAGVAQLLFQLPFLVRIRLLPVPVPRPGHEGVARIKRLMLPALFGVSVSQINLLFDTVIASLLVTGSVSWLYYSDRLMELPLGTFGVAIAIVVLPSLSRKHAGRSMDEFSATLDWALRLVCLIALPATLALCLIAEPLLVTLFQNENFTAFDVERSAASLRAYAFGLTAFMAVKILAPGFYARQNTRAPVRIGIIAMSVNMVLNVGFYLSGLAHVGLALATSLAAVLNAGLLLRGLRREKVLQFQPGWLWLFLQMLAANAVMSAVLLGLAGPWREWMQWGVAAKVGQLSLLVLGGLLAYLLSLYVCGLRPRHLLR